MTYKIQERLKEVQLIYNYNQNITYISEILNISYYQTKYLIKRYILNGKSLQRKYEEKDTVKTRLYRIWNAIKTRCNNPNHVRYYRYGGRGISMCEIWYDFKVFKEWSLSHGYNDELTIHRIDSNKNYEPDNCKWITLSDNVREMHIDMKITGRKFNRKKPAKPKVIKKLKLIEKLKLEKILLEEELSKHININEFKFKNNIE